MVTISEGSNNIHAISWFCVISKAQVNRETSESEAVMFWKICKIHRKGHVMHPAEVIVSRCPLKKMFSKIS